MFVNVNVHVCCARSATEQKLNILEYLQENTNKQLQLLKITDVFDILDCSQCICTCSYEITRGLWFLLVN